MIRRAALLGCVLVLAAVAAGSASAASSCSSDASYRSTLSRLVFAADFLGTVQQVQGWEQKRLYDRVGPQFKYQAATPMAPLPAACSSGQFAAAAAQATILRGSMHRIAVQLAAFPSKTAATQAQWRPVLGTAIAGTTAAVRLADALGGLQMKRTLLAGQLRSLTAIRKSLG